MVAVILKNLFCSDIGPAVSQSVSPACKCSDMYSIALSTVTPFRFLPASYVKLELTMVGLFSTLGKITLGLLNGMRVSDVSPSIKDWSENIVRPMYCLVCLIKCTKRTFIRNYRVTCQVCDYISVTD